MSRPRRKYSRLTPSKWAEIRGRWETGEATLEELAIEHGVSRRTLQTHFSKHGSKKGAEATALAAAVKKEIFDGHLSDKDMLVRCTRDTRETAYRNAVEVEALMMAQLELAKDPAQVARASAAIMCLATAAAGLERLHSLKYRALGLDKDDAQADELPVLVIRDVRSEDIAAIHAGEEETDAASVDDEAIDVEPGNVVTPDDDEIIVFESDDELVTTTH